MTVKAFGPVLVVDDLGVPIGATVGAFSDPDTGVAIPALGLDGVTPVTVATSPRGVTGQWMLDVPAAGYVFATFGTMRLALAPLGADPVAGLPVGGTTGQALVKASGADGDVVWQTVAGGSGSVASVNGKTGTVVLAAADVDAATSAQGAKADTASQPGHTHTSAEIVSGTLAAARLGTGTADSTTVLHGDGTWQPEASGGGAYLTGGQQATPTWHGCPLPSTGGNNVNPVSGTIYLCPHIQLTAQNANAMAVNISGAGDAGSLAQLLLYGGADGVPETLLWASPTFNPIAGQLSYTIDPAFPLAPGTYWLGFVATGTTMPQVPALIAAPNWRGWAPAENINSVAASMGIYTRAGVSPGSPPATLDPTTLSTFDRYGRVSIRTGS